VQYICTRHCGGETRVQRGNFAVEQAVTVLQADGSSSRLSPENMYELEDEIFEAFPLSASTDIRLLRFGEFCPRFLPHCRP
jgi:hypothetical protein